MDATHIGTVIGLVMIGVVAGIYYAVRAHRQNTYGGRATARVIRLEKPVTVKPYEVRVVFAYEVEGRAYEGFDVRLTEKAPRVGDCLEIRYKKRAPEKYVL